MVASAGLADATVMTIARAKRTTLTGVQPMSLDGVQASVARLLINGHDSDFSDELGTEPIHVVELVLRECGERTWLLDLVRGGAAEDSQLASLKVLLRLGPLFGLILEQIVGLEQEAAHGRAGWGLLDRVPLGIGLIDSGGRVHAANRRLSTLSSAMNGLEIQAERVRFESPELLSRFSAAVRSLLDLEQPDRKFFRIERADGVSCTNVLLWRFDMMHGSRPDDDLLALFVANADSPQLTECLREMYELTRVEAEVANLVCQGFTPQEIAVRMRMSIHTVRGYLRPVFKKTGARRQADLSRLVASACGLMQMPAS